MTTIRPCVNKHPKARWHSIVFSTLWVSQCQVWEWRRQQMKCDPWQSVDKLLKHNESTSIVRLNAMPQQYLVTRSCPVCVQRDLNVQLLDTQLRHYGLLFIAWLFPQKIWGGLKRRCVDKDLFHGWFCSLQIIFTVFYDAHTKGGGDSYEAQSSKAKLYWSLPISVSIFP